MKRRHFPIVIIIMAMFAGCKPVNVPREQKTATDSVFVVGDFRFYGAYYPSIEGNVFSIDLLSKGLQFDSLFHIVGTGTNLYLSDIFLPATDSVLQSGIYDIDTTAAPYTILPGMRFGRAVTGAYVAQMREGNVTDTLLFTRGQMTLTQWADSINLDFQLFTADSSRYHGTYLGRVSYR